MIYLLIKMNVNLIVEWDDACERVKKGIISIKGKG